VTRDDRQSAVFEWAKAAFSEEQASSPPQRGLRLLEEAVELFQACGGDRDSARRLVDFVFDRPPGEIGQEIGGVGVTTLALAAAVGLSADAEERREVDRVLSRPVEEFARRNRAKNDAGFLLVQVKNDDGFLLVRPGEASPAGAGSVERAAAASEEPSPEACFGCGKVVLLGADVVTMGDGTYRHRVCAPTVAPWRLTTTRKDLNFRDDLGHKFDVVLAYDEEFRTWDAHASVGGLGGGTEGAALEKLRLAADQLSAALVEIVA
jgi:hypothetical protein